MASKQEKQQQLGDLLRQEQEPFALDLNLLERGYFSKNRLKLESTSSRFTACCNGCYSNKYCLSRIFRALLNKFTRTISTVSNNNNNNNATYYCDHSMSEEKITCVNEKNNNNGQEVSELESSVTTVFNSPTSLDEHCDSVEAHTLDGLRLTTLTEEEGYAGREFQCQFMAKYDQLSPISVLQQSHQC